MQLAARDQYLTKAPLKQKSPLTRAQVEELERRTVESADTKLVCVLGQILFCLHASCRWSDSQRVVVISRQEADGVVLLVVDALTAKAHLFPGESEDSPAVCSPWQRSDRSRLVGCVAESA